MFKRIFMATAVSATILGLASPQARANSDLQNNKPLAGGVTVSASGLQAATPSPMIPSLTQLDKFGLHCLSQSKSPVPALITDVGTMSPAYNSGLKSGDNIIALQTNQDNFALTIKRDGKLYGVTLRGGAQNHPFTELEIARVGHNGVKQQALANCWFEAGLSAVADTRDGPGAIANMITAIPSGYSVKFPGVQTAVTVTIEQIVACGAADPAPWASILEAAETKVYPDNSPARGAMTGNPGVKVGLEMLSGRPVSFVRPKALTVTELSSLLTRLRQAGKPITMASMSPAEHGQNIQPLTPNHAYSLVDFDSSSGLITLRNPYGREGRSGAGIVTHLSQDEIQLDLQTLRTFFRFIAYPE